MRINAELHRFVVWFIRHECNDEEVDAFFEQLEKLRLGLLDDLEGISDPSISKYRLQFFRFKNCIAIFETNRARDKIKIRLCRRVPPIRSVRKKRRDDV